MSELKGLVISVLEVGFTEGQQLGEFISSDRNQTNYTTAETMEVGSKREVFTCKSGEEITFRSKFE